jgi:AcrR family transcriptional regulator
VRKRHTKSSSEAAPISRRPGSRYSADEARDAILAATEKRLLEVGPQGLRIQEIAEDVGLSHPTVLHHFGSREALVHAVTTRAMLKLQTDLLACFQGLDIDADPFDLTLEALERVDDELRSRGHARLLAWLVLGKLTSPPEVSLLRDLARAIESAWEARAETNAREDASFSVLLTTTALFGLAIIGPEVLSMLGLPRDEATVARFREWFARKLSQRTPPSETPRSR